MYLNIHICCSGTFSGPYALSLLSVCLTASLVSTLSSYALETNTQILSVDDDILMDIPELYRYGREGYWFNLKTFLLYLFC